MNKTDFMEGIHILQDNYNKKLSNSQLKLYYENLKDMSKDKFLCNVREEIRNNPFMPNIAQLRCENNKNYTNYQQREYENVDFNQFYANKRG